MAGDRGSKYYDIFLRHQLEMISGDEIIISEEGFRLILAIEKYQSITSAANELGISYRKAWGMVRDIENNLGFCLAGKKRGGKSGGRTILTAEGMALASAYRDLLVELDQSDKEIIRKFFRRINPLREQ